MGVTVTKRISPATDCMEISTALPNPTVRKVFALGQATVRSNLGQAQQKSQVESSESSNYISKFQDPSFIFLFNKQKPWQSSVPIRDCAKTHICRGNDYCSVLLRGCRSPHHTDNVADVAQFWNWGMFIESRIQTKDWILQSILAKYPLICIIYKASHVTL